jgi:hypothetical protein
LEAKRTCRERRELVDPARLTHLGHEGAGFAAMHGP